MSQASPIVPDGTPPPPASTRPVRCVDDPARARSGEKVKSLVQQLVSCMSRSEPSSKCTATPAGTVLLDTEVDDVRCVLIAAGTARAMLTPREEEVCRLVAIGHPNKQIADILGISGWTVGTHLKRIFGKLRVRSRAAMIAAVATRLDTRRAS